MLLKKPAKNMGNGYFAGGVTFLSIRVWWLVVIYVLAFWLYYERIIMAEEAYLENKFGEVYRIYARKTPVFIPNLKLWKSPELPFSLKKVLKREYHSLFALITVFALIDLLENYAVTGYVIFDPTWTSIFIFGLVFYLTIMLLTKKTRILLVEE